MDRMRIIGGRTLKGSINVSGAKNAALPILFSALLSSKKSHFSRVPLLQDIYSTLGLLEHLGVVSDRGQLEDRKVVLAAPDTVLREAPYDLVRKMRASVLVMGPLLARFGYAKVSLPGGCAIGARPINYHLMGFEKLGAEIELDQGYVIAKAKRLVGGRVTFEFPSVGATENVLMAAVLAKGESILENCAREPEIVDLVRSLRTMGAVIEGEGSETIRVQGKEDLDGANYTIIGDRIEAGTFLCAGLITGGSVRVDGIAPEALEVVLTKFEEMGAQVNRYPDAIQVVSPLGRVKGVDATTQPFPGFPTDMQAQLMSVLCLAEGASVLTETIFENRFMHVPELTRMGAEVTIRGKSALIRGVSGLKGAPVMATDLRASASLILAGLAAKGETWVNRIYHLDRGYESMEKKLQQLGAEVERVKE